MNHKMTNAIQRSAIKKERRLINLGTYEGEGVQWIEIINTDRRWYLVSQHLYPSEIIKDFYFSRFDASEWVPRIMARWISEKFRKEFEPSIKWFADKTGNKLHRLHAISFLEVDHILTKGERIACPKGSNTPAPWYLDTTHTNDREHCMFVNEQGEIITADRPKFGDIAYVRLGLELLTENNPYWDKKEVLGEKQSSENFWFYDWPEP